jgi:DNA replication protein DnaC
MTTLKQENAMDDAAAMTEEILKLFNAANMTRLANGNLYLGMPYPILKEFLEALNLQHLEDGNKRFRNRMRYAGIFKERTENTFCWDDDTYPQIEPGAIEQALTIEFVRQKRNLIMAGPQGVGKTLLTIILACKALREEFSVKYKTAHDIVTELLEARVGNILSGYIKKMQAYDVLVIEDFTFSSPDINTAQAFFSIIDKRYGRKSTIITTNKSIKKWIADFPDSSMCIAFLGRLYEDALWLNMNGAKDMRLKRAEGMIDSIEGDSGEGADVGGDIGG